jgi:hypothetical protein
MRSTSRGLRNSPLLRCYTAPTVCCSSRPAWVALMVSILVCLATGTHPPTAFADSSPQQARSLVSTALSALASRDGQRLALLYASEPYLVCTDMDRVVRAEIAAAHATDVRYRLSNFLTSRTALLSEPRVVELPNGRIAVSFSFHWDYQLNGEDPHSTTIVVSWILEPRGGSLRISSQKTFDPDEISPGCGP